VSDAAPRLQPQDCRVHQLHETPPRAKVPHGHPVHYQTLRRGCGLGSRRLHTEKHGYQLAGMRQNHFRQVQNEHSPGYLRPRFENIFRKRRGTKNTEFQQ